MGFKASLQKLPEITTSSRRNLLMVLMVVMLLPVITAFWWYWLEDGSAPLVFSGEQAYLDVVYQVELGPRLPGSAAHAAVREYIQDELDAAGWQVEEQATSFGGHQVYNLIGRRGVGRPWILLGAHYDSRLIADRDPDPAMRSQPVPGANDGASGVAVLLELARTLPADLKGELWLGFFDAEDNGDLESWDWILGSQAFVAELEGEPDAVVIVDMIGDADLNIYRERSSDQVLVDELWAAAAEAGYAEQFINAPKWHILDDHTPFLRAGIPAADIIDFDYPYWHTTADTPDKVAPASLQAVGDTLTRWLMARMSTPLPD